MSDVQSLVNRHSAYSSTMLSFVMEKCRTDLVTRENVYDCTLATYELHWDYGDVVCRMLVNPKKGANAIMECEVTISGDKCVMDASQLSSEYTYLISEYCEFGLISFKEHLKEGWLAIQNEAWKMRRKGL